MIAERRAPSSVSRGLHRETAHTSATLPAASASIRQPGPRYLFESACRPFGQYVRPARANSSRIKSYSSVAVPTVDRGLRVWFLLPDRDRRRDAVDFIDIRLFHALQKLARIRRKRFDVAALPFGVDGVKDQRRLARSGHARHHGEFVVGNVHIDILEVVDPRPMDDDRGEQFPVWRELPWSVQTFLVGGTERKDRGRGLPFQYRMHIEAISSSQCEERRVTRVAANFEIPEQLLAWYARRNATCPGAEPRPLFRLGFGSYAAADARDCRCPLLRAFPSPFSRLLPACREPGIRSAGALGRTRLITTAPATCKKRRG